MRVYTSAHRAARAVAADRGVLGRVTNWLSYTDRLRAEGTIRPILNRNGQIKRWVVLTGREWWVVRTEGERAGIVSGPHRTKGDAMRWAGYSTSTKVTTSIYRLTPTLLVAQTEKLGTFGLTI